MLLQSRFFSLARVAVVALLVASVADAVRAADAVEPARTGGPYVPTPQTVVDAMLKFADVRRDDVVMDLGSGDGRVVLTAARRYGSSGVGVDIDAELVADSTAKAKSEGLAALAKFRKEDVLLANVSKATVVSMYLLPGMTAQLQPKLLREMRPGARIVSHDFTFGDWKPDREMTIDVPEKYGTPGNWKSTIFLWIVPAHVDGAWKLRRAGPQSEHAQLTLQQKFQQLEGALDAGGQPLRLRHARMEGPVITFQVTLPDGAIEHYRGKVGKDRIQGEIRSGERNVSWSALRLTGGIAAGAAGGR